MPKVTAGCLVRHVFDDEVRWLVVHPSGNYNRGKPWSIPKGLVEPGEDPETAAIRETMEETNLAVRILRPIGEIRYRKTGKRVIGFLAELLEPPPGTVIPPGDWEIDQAEFVPLDEARRRLHPDQRELLDRALEGEVGSPSPAASPRPLPKGER